MPGDYIWKDRLPVAPLKLIAMPGCEELTKAVNDHIVEYRHEADIPDHKNADSLHYAGYDTDSYLLDVDLPRFGTGEGKGTLLSSCRGCDVFIFVDVLNHSLTYTVNGRTNHLSPDDHYQNLKRIIAASISHARRVTVVMPFLYESRQHKRTARESLDCATALEELAALGVHDIITFDAHDPRIVNATPLDAVDNFMPTYQFVKAILKHVPELEIHKDHLMCISPDEGAMDRAVYLANNLGVDMGMFYKRRDYSQVIDGKNPIVAHEFLGANVQGKDVIIVDDMISSGDSMIDTARDLKARLAKRVIVCTTFGLYTNGLDAFDKAYADGLIDYVVNTNLNYKTPEIQNRKWYIEADMSRYIAAIVNTFNHDTPISDSMSPTAKIQKLLENKKSDGYEYFQTIQ